MVRGYFGKGTLYNEYIIYQCTEYNDIKIILSIENMEKLIVDYKKDKEDRIDEADLPF